MQPFDAGVLIWFVVAFLAASACLEFKSKIEAYDWPVAIAMMMCTLWPMLVALGAFLGVAWLGGWIVRGPIRLVRWLRDRRAERRLRVDAIVTRIKAARSELPKAQVRR